MVWQEVKRKEMEISDSQEITNGGWGDELTPSPSDSYQDSFADTDYSGGSGLGIDGLFPNVGYPGDSTDQGYGLCINESMINLTSPSLFCDNNYSHPYISPDNYSENARLEEIVSRIVPVLFGIIFVVGLFGNALVVLVVASNQQMRNTTNILIINLAMADLLFIIFCVPFTAADYVMRYWPFGEIWCKTVQYLIIVTAYVSVYTLVIMSVDRFLAVVYPVASISIRTERNTYWAIAITWIITLLSCLPALPAHGLSFYTYAFEQQAACTFKPDYNHAAFQISFMLTSYAIPLTIICLLYFGMLFRLWKSVSSAGASRQSLRGKKRVTRMVVVVVGVFAVCWLPIQTVLLLKSLNLYEITDLTVAIQITAHVLGYMNSCVNPILYAFLSDNFRKAFRKVIQCKALSLNAGPPVSTGSRLVKHRPSNAHCNPTPQMLQSEVTKETTLLALHCENGGTRGATNHVISFKNGNNPLENQDIV